MDLIESSPVLFHRFNLPCFFHCSQVFVNFIDMHPQNFFQVIKGAGPPGNRLQNRTFYISVVGFLFLPVLWGSDNLHLFQPPFF